MAHLYLAAFLTFATLAQLSVAQEPFLQLLPNNILKAVGKGVYVSCGAKVDNPELVTEMAWFGPTGDKIPGNDQEVGTLDDGTAGKLDLIIEKLRDQDTGNYTCTATYAGNQKLSSVVLIESFMDISFGDTPLHQTPILHTEATIQCMPLARPPPQVDWLKDMIPLKNDENHIIQQDGVLIKNVSVADEGTYRCRARVLELGSVKYKDIQVEVYVKPKITEAPTDTKGVEKETVTFNCKASGKPVPSYSWVDKDNRPLLGVEDFYVDPEEGVLTIMNLKPEHTGDYRCTASNPVGDAFHSAHLQVLTKPKIEQYLNITGAVDTEIEMRCVVSGDPAPEVVFKKETNDQEFNQGYNEDDRISVTQEQDEQGNEVGILKISQLSRSDDGLYTCTGNSEGGVTQAWGHITTEFVPSFEDQPFTEIWSWNQAPINLTCLATSIPNATIQWYLRNQEIDANDLNLQVMSLGPIGVLRVNPLSASYFGDYTCQATNTLGMAELNIELKEAHVPGPISHSQVEKKTATTITWSLTDPADDGGLAIQGYVVQYRLRDTNWDESEEKFWTKGSSYTLDDLTPMETYVFRFAARSEAGIGEWGGEKDEEMPRHAQPEEPLIFNSKPGVNEIPYSSYYTLQWKVPLDNGREIDYFQISYFQVKNASGTWEAVGSKTTEQIEFPGVSSFKIEDLRANAHYKIELRAHNDIGYSTPAEIIIKTANDPSAPESGIAPGGTSVHLSSSAPPPPSTTIIMSTPAHGTSFLLTLCCCLLSSALLAPAATTLVQ